MSWNAKHCVMTVRDGSGLSQATGAGTGTVSIPNLSANSNAEIIDIRDRMAHYAAITGPEATHDFTTEIVLDAGDITANAVLSAIRRSGTWAAATSIETPLLASNARSSVVVRVVRVSEPPIEPRVM